MGRGNWRACLGKIQLTCNVRPTETKHNKSAKYPRKSTLKLSDISYTKFPSWKRLSYRKKIDAFYHEDKTKIKIFTLDT